ncbi:MAG: diaminopimelate epimerase [candidate division KSB1 bacterium]|nr:diaminopimelate epimerase [candidate division KSB1 bacterium]MDZ7276414.1 diaminopimelate epimerase [candidate division KSB1 bacterium]MDZ7288085.1 diaminopimelate epimerase [candidate division KSB1 bacterium]MDZ7300185.1 diaminopimelate epimerase [candidate division KSB1 bacterium]MDZ7305757.1 diaminopimelate epimerase [candidate division KSB1 bacterium]
MTASLPFIKYSATGNDFILIDNRASRLQPPEQELFQRMCRRHTGIGADGILLLENPRLPDCAFTMRYFNRDGRESEMCGNGARACAYHACRHGLAPADLQFEVSGARYRATVEGERVHLHMPAPRDLRLQVGALAGMAGVARAQCHEGGFVNTGVPHYVVFVAQVDQIPVHEWGPVLRHHPLFAPAGTNVNFVEVCAPNQLRLRTYERGVEEETLACGTGAVAAAWLAHRVRGATLPVTLQVRGGELEVDFEPGTHRPRLTGRVEMVFAGEFIR